MQVQDLNSEALGAHHDGEATQIGDRLQKAHLKQPLVRVVWLLVFRVGEALRNSTMAPGCLAEPLLLQILRGFLHYPCDRFFAGAIFPPYSSSSEIPATIPLWRQAVWRRSRERRRRRDWAGQVARWSVRSESVPVLGSAVHQSSENMS